jgi:hypothetical protein
MGYPSSLIFWNHARGLLNFTPGEDWCTTRRATLPKLTELLGASVGLSTITVFLSRQTKARYRAGPVFQQHSSCCKGRFMRKFVNAHPWLCCFGAMMVVIAIIVFFVQQ